MKKIYKSLSIFAFALVCKNGVAQAPTITSVAMPAVGSTYHMIGDTIFTDIGSIVVSVGTATAQTWNYSANFITTKPDSTSFVAPTGNPGASNFPSANLASNQGGGIWGYITTSSSGANLIGVDINASGVTAALTFTPAIQEFPVPFTYLNTVSSISTATANSTYSGTPIKIIAHQNQTITADAFGTVITPTGTYSNTLRYRVKSITSDSVISTTFGSVLYSTIDSTIEYSWYENTANALVMRITLSAKNDSVRKAQYIKSVSSTGIEQFRIQNSEFRIYPNPTSGITYLNYENVASSTVSASIFDVTGRQVTSIINNQQQSAGKHTLNIDINNIQLPQGLYMVQLIVNGSIKTIKLNVQ